MKDTASSSSTPVIHTSKRDHVIFIIVTLLYWSSLYIYVPVLPEFLKSRGLTLGITGVVLGSYGFIQLLVRLPLGIASDRFMKRKPFMMLGLIATAASCLVFPLSGFAWPLVARILAGVSASAWVAFTVLYSSYFPSKDVARAMGSISVITAVGQLVGMLASGWVADHWGYRSLFLIGAMFAVVGLAVVFLVKEPQGGVVREPIRLRNLKDVLTPTLLSVSTLSILAHSVLFITMFGFTPLQAQVLGASKTGLTLLVCAFMIPHAFSNFISGRYISPKYGAGKTIVAGFVLSAICTLLIPVVPTYGLLALTQVFNGFAQGLHFPLFLGLSIRDTETDKRATAMGFYQAVYSVGMFAGPFIAGWLNDSYGLRSGFYLGGMIALASAAFTVLLTRRSILR
ncbi:MAG: MFS transporter [Gorillibacterium sp.]|nr:MFS transporter [Gorillibacterium sp.]